MEINITLLGQLITFIVLVGVTMKYIWPPIAKIMQEREQRIADGLAAGERGQHALELAQHKVGEQLRDAKIHAAAILDQANKQANQLVEEAKERAREEGERLLTLARGDIAQAVQTARQGLRHEIADLAVQGAQQILMRNIDGAAQHDLIEKMLAEI